MLKWKVSLNKLCEKSYFNSNWLHIREKGTDEHVLWGTPSPYNEESSCSENTQESLPDHPARIYKQQTTGVGWYTGSCVCVCVCVWREGWGISETTVFKHTHTHRLTHTDSLSHTHTHTHTHSESWGIVVYSLVADEGVFVYHTIIIIIVAVSLTRVGGWSRRLRRLIRTGMVCWTWRRSTSYCTRWTSTCPAGRSNTCSRSVTGQRWNTCHLSLHYLTREDIGGMRSN